METLKSSVQREGKEGAMWAQRHWVDDLNYITEGKSTVCDIDKGVCQPSTTQICISHMSVISQCPKAVILLHLS